MNGSLLALGTASALALGAAASVSRGSRGLRWRMEGQSGFGVERGQRVRETVETVDLPARAAHWGFPAGREATSTLQDLRDHGYTVTPIGMEDEEAVERVERVYPAGALFHVREGVPPRTRTLVLQPRVPRTPLPGEDRHTPRVSLAPRLGGALWGLGFHTKITREERPWDVYVNVNPVHGVIPSFLDVPDKDESGEVWSLTPVPVTRVGTLSPDVLWKAHAIMTELAFRTYRNRRAPWTPRIQNTAWTAAEAALGPWRT